MELPKRKTNRLKDYDYTRNGAYFITVCVNERRPLLSRISVGAGLALPEPELLPPGKIAEEQLLMLQERWPGLFIDRYVIMPNHIHFLMRLETTGGASCTE